MMHTPRNTPSPSAIPLPPGKPFIVGPGPSEGPPDNNCSTPSMTPLRPGVRIASSRSS